MKKILFLILSFVAFISYSQTTKKITQFPAGTSVGNSTIFQGSDGNDTLKKYTGAQLAAFLVKDSSGISSTSNSVIFDNGGKLQGTIGMAWDSASKSLIFKPIFQTPNHRLQMFIQSTNVNAFNIVSWANKNTSSATQAKDSGAFTISYTAGGTPILDWNSALGLNLFSMDTLATAGAPRFTFGNMARGSAGAGVMLSCAGSAYFGGQLNTGGGAAVVSGGGLSCSTTFSTGKRCVVTPLNTGNVVAATGITGGMLSGDMRYNGASAIDISADPQIVDGVDGETITIIGTSNTNTLKLDNGTGLVLTGGASITLGLNDVITLMYANSDWIELNRADN